MKGAVEMALTAVDGRSVTEDKTLRNVYHKRKESNYGYKIQNINPNKNTHNRSINAGDIIRFTC